MTDKINEQISALTDGELPDEERELLERRLTGDEALRTTWQHYHLIRDAMREDLPAFINTDSDLEYISAQPETAVVAGNRSFMGRHGRTMGGFAIAASVAMMAVVGVLYNEKSFNTPAVTPQIASQSTLPDTFSVAPRTGWESAKPTVVSHLNGYLVDHSRYAGFSSAQGILPYSRIAGYDQGMPDKELNGKKQEY